jgi:uncharacterized protein
LHRKDSLHQRAVAIGRSLAAATQIVTSEMVLTELLNAFAEQGIGLRHMAIQLIQRLRQDPNTRIIPQSTVQFEEALDLYRSRPDKEWSHTDCASFRVMEEEGIAEALTYDRHFEQAGFKALLR